MSPDLSNNSQKRIRILIVDDHAIVRKGLAGFIESRPDLELVAEAENGMDAVEKAREVNPDVILMDLVMPKMDGITAIAEIKKDNPGARILVLTSFGEDNKVFPAIQAGAQGYMLKDSSPEELFRAIRQTFNDEAYQYPTIARNFIVQHAKENDVQASWLMLTDRENEVLQYLAQGYSNREIAQCVYIQEKTVRFHVSNILKKLNVESRTQAVLFAIQKGLVPTENSHPGQQPKR